MNKGFTQGCRNFHLSPRIWWWWFGFHLEKHRQREGTFRSSYLPFHRAYSWTEAFHRSIAVGVWFGSCIPRNTRGKKESVKTGEFYSNGFRGKIVLRMLPKMRKRRILMKKLSESERREIKFELSFEISASLHMERSKGKGRGNEQKLRRCEVLI